MYKILVLTIDAQPKQCVLINHEPENNQDFKQLEAKDPIYSLVIDQLSGQGNYYYQVKPIVYFFVYHPTSEGNEPFMRKGQPTVYAEKVFENYYYQTEEKVKLVQEIEAGISSYTLYHCSEEYPENALPLFNLSLAESKKIRAETKKNISLIPFKFT